MHKCKPCFTAAALLINIQFEGQGNKNKVLYKKNNNNFNFDPRTNGKSYSRVDKFIRTKK